MNGTVTVVIPAAGQGVRLGLGPKGLLELGGTPLVTWVTRKALTLTDDVVVAAPPGLEEDFARHAPGCRIITGGHSRQQSISRLAGTAQRDWVVLVDVARPFFSSALLVAVLEAADTGAAGTFLPLTVPVAHLAESRVVREFPPGEAGVFQAPQAFARPLLESVLERARRHGWCEQSTLQLFLRAGEPVASVIGEPANIKITTPLDWRFARTLVDHLN